MKMAEIFRLAALCLLGTVTVLLFQRNLPEFAFVAAVAVGAVISVLLLQKVSQNIAGVAALLERGGLTEQFSILLKAVGIAYITAFCADTCRDFGQSSLAAKAELCGRVAILLCGLPLLEQLLDVALEFASP